MLWGQRLWTGRDTAHMANDVPHLAGCLDVLGHSNVYSRRSAFFSDCWMIKMVWTNAVTTYCSKSNHNISETFVGAIHVSFVGIDRPSKSPTPQMPTLFFDRISDKDTYLFLLATKTIDHVVTAPSTPQSTSPPPSVPR